MPLLVLKKVIAPLQDASYQARPAMRVSLLHRILADDKDRRLGSLGGGPGSHVLAVGTKSVVWKDTSFRGYTLHLSLRNSLEVDFG